MDIEQLRALALSFPAVTEDIKWGDHLCFNVGDKMFLLTSPDELPINACFKVSEEDFDALIDRSEQFGRAAHFAQRKWITIRDIHSMSQKEWRYYLKASYDAVVAKLTKKRRAELGI